MIQDIFKEDKKGFLGRINKRITRVDFAFLLLNLGFLLIFIWHFSQGYPGFYDYQNYIRGAEGDPTHFYYAYWALPIFKLLGAIPEYTGIFLWGVINLAGIFWGLRVFGNQTIYLLLSYQLIYVLFYGQITGLIIGGLGLLWFGIKCEKGFLAGLGFSIAAIKYYIGVPLAAALIIFGWRDWKTTVRILSVPVFVLLVTLLFDLYWPMRVIQTIASSPPNLEGSISLWRWIGPFALLLFLPILFFPYTQQERFTLFTIGLGLSLPYFQQTEMLTIFVQPIGWLALFGNLGFGFIFFQWDAFIVLTISLLLIYSRFFRMGFLRLRKA